jgi:hypothetical protein
VQGAGLLRDLDARSDADGRMTIPFLEPHGTAVDLTVYARRRTDESVCATTAASPETAPLLTVVLRETVPVRIDARGPDGRPVADPDVSFSGASWSASSREQVWHLDPDATYDASVSARGFLTQEIAGFRPPPGGGTLAATLFPAAAVRGRVVDERGEPVCRVHAGILGEKDSCDADLLCAPDGTFLLEDVPEGSGLLHVRVGSEPADAFAEVTTVSGRVTDVGTLRASPRVAWTGRIIGADGRPVGGAVVQVVTTACSDPFALTRADGTFRVRAPASSAMHLDAWKAGVGCVRAELIAGASRSLGDLVLAPEVEEEVPLEEVER